MKLIDMSKPKNMTLEQEAAWNEKQQEYYRKYREANRKKLYEKAREYRKANPKKILENARKMVLKRYYANYEKAREQKLKWNKANPEKIRKTNLKFYCKTRNQAAADQFFILSAAAQQISDIKLTK
jgi:hypothetical protein